MKNTKNAIIMITSIMVIVGTTLTPVLQQQVKAALQLRSQHMDQENNCFRSNTCRQSDVGQNTLGNDNSITGFADQSDNIQQSTSANKTTPTPTPTPATTTLTVIKIVAGNATNATASDFSMHVTGNNPTPANFAGSTTGTTVTLGPGAFNVTETLPAGSFFTTTTTGDCSGTIAAGQHLTCTITNTAKTCEECFTSLLTQAQINVFLEAALTTSLADTCAILQGGNVTEVVLREILASSGVDPTTINDLIACLKDAGIVFRPT